MMHEDFALHRSAGVTARWALAEPLIEVGTHVQPSNIIVMANPSVCCLYKNSYRWLQFE